MTLNAPLTPQKKALNTQNLPLKMPALTKNNRIIFLIKGQFCDFLLMLSIFFVIAPNAKATIWWVPHKSICNHLIALFPSPIFTAELFKGCEQSLLLDSLFAHEKSLEHFEDSFFVPIKAQWVQSVSLAQALSQDVKVGEASQKISSLGHGISPKDHPLIMSFNLIYRATMAEDPDVEEPQVISELWMSQLKAFSRDEYVFLETPRNLRGPYLDYKRVIHMMNVENGTLVRHILAFKFSLELNESQKINLAAVEKKLFHSHTELVKSQIAKELASYLAP